jgi:hypothetical protein
MHQENQKPQMLWGEQPDPCEGNFHEHITNDKIRKRLQLQNTVLSFISSENVSQHGEHEVLLGKPKYNSIFYIRWVII